MFDVLGQYQAWFFGDMADIVPSTGTFQIFLEMFKDKNLLPNTFQEIKIPKGIVPRVGLLSENGEWQIQVGSQHILFEKNPIQKKGANMGPVDNFVRDVEDFCGRILDKFPKKAGRLSLITRGLLGELTDVQNKAVYESVVRNVPFYAESLPVEWELRSARRVQVEIEGKKEVVNVNAAIKFTEIQLIEAGGIRGSNRIEVLFDVNTFQGNMDGRFGAAGVHTFLKNAVVLRERVLKEMEERLHA